MPSLKDSCKDRLLKMVKEVAPESGWKVIVVDKVCCKILSAAMTLAEVMEHGVTLIENLEVHPRQPMPEMDVIYFMRPTTHAIQMMLKDFEKEDRPTYGHIHLYFSSRLEDTGLALIRENRRVLRRIRTLKELNLEFRSYESQVYLMDTDSDNSFHSLYNPGIGGRQSQEQTQIAIKLLTLCVTLNEYPVIRYGRNMENARQIADKLQDRLDQFGRVPNTDWRPNTDSQATLLILDRSVDALSPLIHEYTYQAMCMDILEIKDDRFKHSITTGAGTQQEKEMLLNENDAIWAKYRHMFIAEASTEVAKEFKTFMAENKTAGLQRRDGASAELSQMSDALRQLPQYRELIEKYSLHLALIGRCMDIHSRGGLEAVAKLEQDMAMGEDGEGRPAAPLEQLKSMLRDSRLSLTMKMRLLMIYIITQEGVREQDLKLHLQQAGISDGEAAAIQAMEHMGVSLQKSSKKFALRLGGGSKDKRRKADGDAYELWRFRPNAQFLVSDIMEEKLSRDDYPWVKPPTASTSGVAVGVGGGGGGAKAPSARSRPTAGWALKNKEKRAEVEQKYQGPRVIICILGGVTFSEVRTAYEMTKQYNREVIIGSTNTLTGPQYIDKLRSIAGAAAM